MAEIGIEMMKREEFMELLKKYNISAEKIYEIEVKTKNDWKKFIIAETIGDVENLAYFLASELKKPCLEGGRHLIKGEVSAGIWRQMFRIYYPDGSYEDVEAYTYDKFLDLKIPSDYVKNLEGFIKIGGFDFKIPLKEKDVEFIYTVIGTEGIKKLKKALEAYGYEKLLDEKAYKILIFGPKPKVEIDYERGVVLKLIGDEFKIEDIKYYVDELISEGNVEEALKIYEKCKNEHKKSIIDYIKRSISLYKEVKLEDKVKLYESFLKKIEK